MIGTFVQWLKDLPAERMSHIMRSVLAPIGYRMSSVELTSGGLRIHGGSASALAQAHTVVYAIANGVLVTKAVDTDMAALAGTVQNSGSNLATFNVFCFFIDQAGTLTTVMGTQGATLGAVQFPPIPEQKALIGFVLINPTGTGDFIGGTTALDDATVVPTAVFVNTTMGFDPTILPR